MLVTGVCVTRTTRDDAYDGNECGLDRGGLPLGSYFVYDLSLPSNCLRNFLIQFFYMCIGTFGGTYIPPKSLGLTFSVPDPFRHFEYYFEHPPKKRPFRQIPNFLSTNREITILTGSQLTMVMNPPNPTQRPQPIHHAIPAAAALLPSFAAIVM